MSTSGEIAEEFRMAGLGLPLSPASEVTTTGKDEAKNNHGQDGRDLGRNAGPVEVDEGDAIDRLIDLSLIHI